MGLGRPPGDAMNDVGLCLEKEQWLMEVPKAEDGGFADWGDKKAEGMDFELEDV